MPAQKVDYFETTETALSQIRGKTFQTVFQIPFASSCLHGNKTIPLPKTPHQDSCLQKIP
jgi:hypothetical protein